MAPTGSRRRRGRRSRSRSSRSQCKRQSVELACSSSSSATTNFDETLKKADRDRDNNSNDMSGCSTPKGQRFRIPDILSCPPAPKKRRVAPNWSSPRSPISFFSPPDLELFFFFALRDISV
ncbi:cyclin-dependent protein kinase inhibitor SMR9-like [Macadamia integrifolia]|uniref:cyclin-dependent protein kinase inhibitor SMR9-like n=1 Tax=Macadamia integrifolia TaxID=60698 RepID=UPI001C4E537D|nr:cyclin-dependent protein kinase inhibitor SMR9-like [Macadamia integrifolia]